MVRAAGAYQGMGVAPRFGQDGGRRPGTSSGVVSDVASGLTWVASGAGAVGSAAAAVAVQPTLLIPVLVIVIPLATLPLLITTLTLGAVYDPDPQRRAAAEKVLERLLVTVRAGRRRGR